MLKSHVDCGRINWASKVNDLLYQYGFVYAWITQKIGDVNICFKCLNTDLYIVTLIIGMVILICLAGAIIKTF